MFENNLFPLSPSFLERGKNLRSLSSSAVDELQRRLALVKVVIEVEGRGMNIPPNGPARSLEMPSYIPNFQN